MTKTILIVDDEPAARYGLRRALESKYRIAEADSAEAARDALRSEKPDLVLLDVVLPGQDGLSFLKGMRDQGSTVPVLMVSALDTAKTAVEALRLGAADYLVKGFELDELRQRVANLLKLASLEEENNSLRRQLATEGQFGGMIGRSEEMRRAFEIADRVAATDSTVLILGESGTGKDLLAQEIHARSTRAGEPFVAVNCAALPETLIESELFGYERGAFTGAAQQRRGKFEQAHGGTLFLDEIGDMNPLTQAKVLRALENRTIERLGGLQTIPVDVRLISATHRDLPAEIRGGKFREDLFYRLRVVTVELPPLRAHKGDIGVLAEAFLKMHGARLNRAPRLSKEALAVLEAYDWPGNVRELKNALERSVVMCRGEEIVPGDLPGEVASGQPLTNQESSNGAHAGMSERDFREAKRRFEVAWITKELVSHRWNVSRTAATIGLHRQSLQEKLRELGIRRPGRELENGAEEVPGDVATGKNQGHAGYLSGYVTAGGASRRFGSDKALVEFDGRTLLSRMCDLVAAATGSVQVIAPRGRYSDHNVPLAEDRWPDEGPLGGIITALLATEGSGSKRAWNLIVSCDMPFLTREWLDYLCMRALASDADVVVPQSAYGLEPLCACWRTAAAAPLQAAFGENVRKVTEAMKRLRMEVLDETYWKRFDSAGQLFWNMNTPQDYQSALRTWRTGQT